MTPIRRRLPAIALAILAVAACGSEPVLTPIPSVDPAALGATAKPAASERPFAQVAWPTSASACDLPDYAGRLGRLEAVNARTIRFTLCDADGAFPARLAHPALGVVDSATVDLVAADPASARLVAGAGEFRVEAWAEGENVRLGRVPSSTASPSPPAAGVPSGSASPVASGARPEGPGSPPATIVLRWAATSADRAAALREAEVDGIDAPAASDIADMSTLPEIVITPRPGTATAYLGFGTGHGFGQTAVRRAFAQGLDSAALARDAFAAGAIAATHVAPCEVAGGCAGMAWYEFNGPAGAAALGLAGYDLTASVPLRIPDGPVAGLPDPAGLAAAIRDQLQASLGVTAEIEEMPAAELATAIAEGDLDGLYLGGIASPLADASGYLEPLFGADATGTAVQRARGVTRALGDVAGAVEDAARRDAFGAINDRIRSAAPIIPLVHPGAMTAYRADVSRVAISPLGVDPLGDFIAGDRSQLVVMQAGEPVGAWCAVTTSVEALQLCGLVTPGLFRFAGASLVPVPSLASRCDPSKDATVWTCRLRSDLSFSDGRRVDAGDVLASMRAQADAGSPLRVSRPATTFATWDDLFRGPVPANALP